MCLALLWAVVMGCGAARAEAGEDRAGPLADTLCWAPADAALFFAVDDAAELRRGPLGGLAIALIDGVAGFTQTFTEWVSFARNLGCRPDEAFDALLGRRVVLVARPGPARTGGLGPWVLMSEVTEATAQRLTDRLKPMPRQLVAGAAVLSVEGGRFQIALSRRDPAGFLLLFSEADGGAMLEQALRASRAGPARGFADSEQAGGLRTVAAGARAMLFVDLSVFEDPDDDKNTKTGAGAGPTTHRGDVPASKGWVVAGVRPTPTGVGLQAAIHSEALAEAARAHAARSRMTWDPGVFEALARSALFASFEANTSVGDLPWVGGFSDVSEALGLGRDLPRRAALSGRLASLLVESSTGIVDGAVALETLDAAALPGIADAEMARMVAHLHTLAPSGSAATIGQGGPAVLDPARFDYGGAAPSATRTLDLSRVVGPTINAAWDDGAKLVWRYDPHDAKDRGMAGSGTPGSGWWTIGLGSAAVERLSGAALLAEPVGAAVRLDWVAMLSVRPRAIVERLEERGVPIVRPLEAARWVTRATWFSALGPAPGVILAGGRVEVSQPPPSAAANPGSTPGAPSPPAPPDGTTTTTPGR